jgi:hypothetical protein
MPSGEGQIVRQPSSAAMSSMPPDHLRHAAAQFDRVPVEAINRFRIRSVLICGATQGEFRAQVSRKWLPCQVPGVRVVHPLLVKPPVTVRIRRNIVMHCGLTFFQRLLSGAGLLLSLLTALGAPGGEPKRVLLVHSFGREFEPFNTFSEYFRSELARQSDQPLDVYDVALQSARFEEPSHEGPFVDYLLALFAGRRLDLVVSIGGPAARFMQQYREVTIGREVSGRRQDGSEFPVDLEVSEIVLADRRIFTGFVRDITERKKAEQIAREFGLGPLHYSCRRCAQKCAGLELSLCSGLRPRRGKKLGMKVRYRIPGGKPARGVCLKLPRSIGHSGVNTMLAVATN